MKCYSKIICFQQHRFFLPKGFFFVCLYDNVDGGHIPPTLYFNFYIGFRIPISIDPPRFGYVMSVFNYDNNVKATPTSLARWLLFFRSDDSRSSFRTIHHHFLCNQYIPHMNPPHQCHHHFSFVMFNPINITHVTSHPLTTHVTSVPQIKDSLSLGLPESGGT